MRGYGRITEWQQRRFKVQQARKVSRSCIEKEEERAREKKKEKNCLSGRRVVVCTLIDNYQDAQQVGFLCTDSQLSLFRVFFSEIPFSQLERTQVPPIFRDKRTRQAKGTE